MESKLFILLNDQLDTLDPDSDNPPDIPYMVEVKI